MNLPFSLLTPVLALAALGLSCTDELTPREYSESRADLTCEISLFCTDGVPYCTPGEVSFEGDGCAVFDADQAALCLSALEDTLAELELEPPERPCLPTFKPPECIDVWRYPEDECSVIE